MLPPRTSPTAKTPGRLVSSRYGGRASGHPAAARSSGDRSGPVLMNPLLVERDASIEPAGVRHGARHHEHVADVVRLDVARPIVAPPDAFEMPVAVQRDELRSRPQGDRRVLLDSANEIARHRVRQAVLADQEVDVPGRLREKHRGLARGVAAADDHDLLAGAQLRLHRRGGVVHARAFELRQVCDRGLAVLAPPSR